MYPYLLFVVFALSTVVNAQRTQEARVSYEKYTILGDSLVQEMDGARISFPNTSYDAGNVLSKSVLTYDFVFTNDGNEPLLISKVRSSCSCTVASYPKTPILPGETGKVKLDLDTQGHGTFNKIVAVYSNAVNNYDDSMGTSRVVLRIKWTVIKKTINPEDELNVD